MLTAMQFHPTTHCLVFLRRRTLLSLFGSKRAVHVQRVSSGLPMRVSGMQWQAMRLNPRQWLQQQLWTVTTTVMTTTRSCAPTKLR